MNKLANFKLIGGVLLFLHAFSTLTTVIVLLVLKRRVPRSFWYALGGSGVISCLLLNAYSEDRRHDRLRESDAFGDFLEYDDFEGDDFFGDDIFEGEDLPF